MFTKRIFQSLLLVLIACMYAGLYGVLHNQISYTVSYEYFTKFKFNQFNIPATIQDRVGAGIVGWFASWWMGLILSAFFIPIGFFYCKQTNYFKNMHKTYIIVMVNAFFISLVGLLFGYVTIQEDVFNANFPNVVHQVDFARAGFMHNMSYFGGVIGTILGIISIIVLRNRSS